MTTFSMLPTAPIAASDCARAPDRLDVPVRGSFRDGVGIFQCEDQWNDTPVTVRFRWSKIEKNSAVWDQAFSTDGGQTWESNWVMDFTRAAL